MQAFPKTSRVRCSWEFRAAFDEGSKVVGPILVAFLRTRSALAGEANSRNVKNPSAILASSLDQRRLETTGTVGSPLRLGAVVSRKVGNAVIRNRVKRHLREAFRVHQQQLEELLSNTAADLVVVARPPAASAGHQEIVEALKQCVLRLSRQKCR